MRLANLAGRSTIVTDEGLIDVAASSKGAFSPSIEKCLLQLDRLRDWYLNASPKPTEKASIDELVGDPRFGPVSPTPSQVFAVGLNYRHHALEMGMELPEHPMVFTKFASSLCGPYDELPIPGTTTDFEAELVVVIGKAAREVSESSAMEVVAGYCVGQDYSERTIQVRGPSAQYSLSKSFKNFSPIGPWLTTLDEIDQPFDLAIRCSVNDVLYQDSRTSDMIFNVAAIVSYLSTFVELRPGDLVFTGSPHGVGKGQNPPFFLKPGDRVVTEIGTLGRLANVAI